MQISEQWLREWVDPALDAHGLAHALTMAGLEVESVEAAAPALPAVRVGRIAAARPHPERSALKLCDVDVGEAEHRPIVCGADNARQGLNVAVALPGAELPDGTEVASRAVHGQSSEGMICSAAELGLSDEADSVMELDATARPGTLLTEHLGLDDTVIELDLTPNRGDCLSVLGIAREAAAVTDSPLTEPEIARVTPDTEDTLAVRVDAPEACPRYVGRIIDGIAPSSESPDWLRERLRRSGVRSVSVLVDITNYVMLELGQPLHAFDLDPLEGGIQVRFATPEDELELLDGRNLEPDADTLVIADDTGARALAGIMGGASSAVGPETRRVFLESALFAPDALAGRARRYGLTTDSSQRFERGVDPALQARAVERATELIVRLAGGRPGPVVDHPGGEPGESPAIRLRPSRVGELLGVELRVDEVVSILSRLGMRVERSGSELAVTPPSFRYDIAIEADLIEEVARIYGYEELPVRQGQGPLEVRAQPEHVTPPERVHTALIDRGYQEAITYSFVPADLQAAIDPETAALDLANPLSSDLARMRTSLWPGLLRALQDNLNRQQNRVRLFEHGRVFLREGETVQQPERIGGLAYGRASPEHWDGSRRGVDFFDVKGDIETICRLTMGSAQVSFAPAEHPGLHPGQSAVVRRDGPAGPEWLGYAGSLHPALAQRLDLPEAPVVFELDLAALSERVLPEFRALSRYPSVRRDLAVVVDEGVTAGAVEAGIRQAAGELLADCVLFDVYRGTGVEEGRKSLAWGLILQHYSRTLADHEIDTLIEGVLEHLRRELGAAIRE